MLYYSHWTLIPKDVWKWKNFHPSEIACKGDGSILIDEDAMNRLQLLRTIIGKPLIINSAYRSRRHNAKIGGSPKSMHRLGKAFDISLTNQDKEELARIAFSAGVGFRGKGFYNTFLHVDTGPTRQWGKPWDY